MYGITNEASYAPENFFAGDYPITKDFGKTKSGVKINRHAPVVIGTDGIEEASSTTIDKVIGIAADDSSNDEVVYYLTGEFFSESIYLPTGVTIKALKPVLRKTGIFFKELNSNG